MRTLLHNTTQRVPSNVFVPSERSGGMKITLLIGVIGSCLLALATAERAPVITTLEGKVSGVVEKAVNGNAFHSYYGIPYASPPLGELRFKDPTAPTAWGGVRDGSKMPPMCLQVRFGKVMAGIKSPPEELDGNEDCLYLNVFSPRDATTSEPNGLPVMVFIHGGGFFAGGAEEYLPHVMLSKDIVLVVIQYRLGFLGFLSTADSVIPGNFGLKDQTMALRWVQRNIRSFGGDPQRVTIFGESAGAASVHFQMLTPQAKGLFSRAITQSGNTFCPWALKTDHAKYAREVGQFVGCNIDEGNQAFLQCLQSVEANKIGVAAQELMRWFVFPMLASPRVDGDYLPDHPVRLMQRGLYNKVNLISGVTADEGAIFSLPLFSRPDLLPALLNNFGENGPYSLGLSVEDSEPEVLTREIYKFYLGGVVVDAEHVDGLTKMMGDRHFKICHDLFSDLHARQKGVSVYRYELLHHGQMSVTRVLNSNIPAGSWVAHGDDLYYLFRGGPLLQPFEPPSDNPTDITAEKDLRLREAMLSLWTNFATTGNPTPDDSLEFRWHATDPNDFSFLKLLPRPRMTCDVREKERDFANSLPTELNRLLHPDLIREKGLKSEL
ncbi:LOW QUALITY PROTEIN: juvenile hormone esterase-like [Macrobrachium nipponense]|uniref:LOW QUALITY PROTEIN: juvenile hormone esterase-like n=1 Tax=Macrobrachium nipponense TaxID=159736 RepID=UPI0030C89481